jgi:putative peptidoglycan lipid II flippase
MALTLPFMPAVCASAVLGGVLHAHGKFVPSAAAPMILNILLIIAALPQIMLPEGSRPSSEQTAYLMGAAAVLAGAVQLMWAVRALRGRLVWTRRVSEAREDTRDVMRRFGPVALGMGTLQLNTMLDTLIAMVPVWIGPVVFGLTYPLDEASNGILGFTQRLYQFPLGVFGIAVATAAFPMLSRAAASDDSSLFVRTLRDALKLSLFIGLPASVGLLLVRGDITASVFGGPGSAFSQEGIDRSSAVLLGYAPAVWIYSLNHVLSRALYAKGDTAGPTRAALIAMAFNMVANLVLIWFLKEAGLAWATAASALLQMLLLIRLVRRTLGSDALIDSDMSRSILRTILLSLAMALAVMGSMWMVDALIATEQTWSKVIWKLLAAVGTGGAVYSLLALALKAPELRMLLRRRVDTPEVLAS